MGKYRKKPVTIEAEQYDGEHLPDIVAHLREHRDYSFQAPLSEDDTARTPPYPLYVHTIEGDMLVKKGDWVIRGVEGEVYPCKDSIFQKTYEAVE